MGQQQSYKSSDWSFNRTLSKEELEEDVYDLRELASDGDLQFGRLLKQADEIRTSIGRDLKGEDLPSEFFELGEECWSIAVKNEEGCPNIHVINETLNQLEDEPYCTVCQAYHEPESQSTCYGLYTGPGGFIGQNGDESMPSLDPTSTDYRGHRWED